MFKKVFFVFLFCIICAPWASAYEYRKIDNLFQKLKSDYTENTNFKDTSLACVKILSQFDKNIKIYNSDTKAYLYHNNDLVKSFKFPSENNNLVMWKQFLISVLDTSSLQSFEISNHKSDIENEILVKIMQNLDCFSRIEHRKKEHSFLKHTMHDGILYIKLNVFNKGTTDYIKKIITSHSDIHGLILDLKGNQGGKLVEAINTADLFLDSGIIAQSKDKYNNIRYYTATSGDILSDKPLVILIDGKTASAAELVVAAFSEQGRAIVIGTKTYGKGSIQNTYTIDDKTLYLTSGYFYSPSGKSINNKGILPQICTGAQNSCIVNNESSSNNDIIKALELINSNLG